MLKRARICILFLLGASMAACQKPLTEHPEKHQGLQHIYATPPHRVPLGMD